LGIVGQATTTTAARAVEETKDPKETSLSWRGEERREAVAALGHTNYTFVG
jgi:hypothetical protein